MTCLDHGKTGNKGGYATCRYQGRYSSLHRKAFCERHNVGLDDIEGSVVRHTCDNPRCINADHLLLGTQADNMQDMGERGRHVSGLPYSDPHHTVNRRRGSEQTHSRWTEAIVLEMRGLYASGEYKQTELAVKYGCRQTDVSRIVRRKAWKHI